MKSQQKSTKTGTLMEKQKLFVESYIQERGNISKACEVIGINRGTYYKWMKKKKFLIIYDEAIERHNDLIYQRILNLALKEDKDMLKFWARTQMKHRGFVEKQEVEHMGGSVGIIFKEVTKSAEDIKDGRKRDNFKREAEGNS